MKEKLIDLLKQSLQKLQAQGLFDKLPNTISLNHSKNKQHGDYATNIAMVLAQQTKPPKAAKDLAQLIIKQLPKSDILECAEVGGAGFINFSIKQSGHYLIIKKALKQKKYFGHSQYGNNQAILIEFVSANPTGPLHIGHGRGAAFGSSLAHLLRAVGFYVHCEYYINDAGRQIDLLTLSVYLRYLGEFDIKINLPSGAYQGDYIIKIAKQLKEKYQDNYCYHHQDILKNINKDAIDKEIYLDNMISNIKALLGKNYKRIYYFSAQSILSDIQADLAQFRVIYDSWFSEQKLIASTAVQKTLDLLTQKQMLYKKSGALWFKSSAYGDEKDRVVVRENGRSTYFAADIAYHLEKFKRKLPNNAKKNYDKIINIWGADHHGYIARVKAGITALGLDANRLEVLLVQFANLYRNEIKIPMSTRSGSFITLKTLREEVGNDAARFFYILRRSDQHIDFDLELAKSKSNENPIYYIQYAHARICQVLSKANLQKDDLVNADLSQLNNQYEQAIIKHLNRYSDVLLNAAQKREPHQLAYYLKDLAHDLHSYYASVRFLNVAKALMFARLALIQAVAITIDNGLNLLGVNAPKQM